VFEWLRDSSKNMCRGVMVAGTGGSKAAFFCLGISAKVLALT